MSAALLVLLGASAAALAGADLSPLTPEALQAAVCAATNEARGAADLPALPVDERLQRAAQLHAEQMAARRTFAHALPEAPLPTVDDRLRAAGAAPGELFASENLATWYALVHQPGDGYRIVDAEAGEFRSMGAALRAHTPGSFGAAAVAWLLSSPPHEAAMLSPEATLLGCGAARFTTDGGFPMVAVVQLFHQGPPPPAPPAAD